MDVVQSENVARRNPEQFPPPDGTNRLDRRSRAFLAARCGIIPVFKSASDRGS